MDAIRMELSEMLPAKINSMAKGINGNNTAKTSLAEKCCQLIDLTRASLRSAFGTSANFSSLSTIYVWVTLADSRLSAKPNSLSSSHMSAECGERELSLAH